MARQIFRITLRRAEGMHNWFNLINSVGIMGALLVGVYELRRTAREARARDEDRRVERSLELHKDAATEGETAEAMNRLSALLRSTGSGEFGSTTWHLLTDEDFSTGGVLDPSEPASQSAWQDLYRVLWFFERLAIARNRGLVNESVLFESLGYHCWWWAQLLRHVQGPKAARFLHALGPPAEEWARREGWYDHWYRSSESDFGGGPPLSLTPTSDDPPAEVSLEPAPGLPEGANA